MKFHVNGLYVSLLQICVLNASFQLTRVPLFAGEVIFYVAITHGVIESLLSHSTARRL